MFDFETNPNLFRKLNWSSDWDAEDLGFIGDFVVGYYTYYDLNFYINMENLEILEAWFNDEEE